MKPKTTTIKSASVKVMLSYDYCHFESSMSLENEKGVPIEDIDKARKACQRLADKAVRQYKTAKDKALKRSNKKWEVDAFEKECLRVKDKAENLRTVSEMAMLKQYEDEAWQEQFDYEYDYDDDENYNL